MNSTRFRIVAAVLVGVMAIALADPAAAFIRLTRQGDTGIVQAHWFDSELPLPSVINPANSDILPATALAVVQASAQSWEDVNTSYFTVDAHEFMGAPELPPALANDGQNSMFFDIAGTNFAPGGGVIAFVRSIISTVEGHTLDADMVYNDRDFYSSISSPGLTPAPPGQTSVDLQAVITHEYGHYYSLDHTSVSGTTMIPFIVNDTTQRSLELDDRAGLSTVYPESASRPGGVTPGGVDFGATTGTITGTVVSGFDGSAIFGAHVEAINLAAPTPANTISAISGELTVRNGQGDFKIWGLPPGSYAVRIVPLDGVNTIASDGNVGGIFNGLDINFEPEFYNGANESGNGFTDNKNDFVAVAVAAGANSGGVGLITNTYAGRVTIAQYGSFENIVTFSNNGHLAVRFDPPFDPPYTIDYIEFPTVTFNGVPATFQRAALAPLNPATGLPDLSAPIVNLVPFAGSPNGVNQVPIGHTVTTAGQTFFWVLKFPSQAGTPGFPNNFPFVRQDFRTLDRGLFANSYSLGSTGLTGGVLVNTNLIASMTCQMSSPDETPIAAPSAHGGNREATRSEFSFIKPTDVRADGFAMAANSLDHMELILRAPFSYVTAATGGAGATSIKLEPSPSSTVPGIYAVQAVDKNGNRSIQSNVAIFGFNEDANEPNGRINEAKALTPPVSGLAATYAPAGDQDFYSVMAKPGDIIDMSATATNQDGRNDLDLTMLLFDHTGALVAFNDDFSGLNPRIVFAVPPPAGNSSSKAPRRFTAQVTDFPHSAFFPTGAPREIVPPTYLVNATVTTPVNAAARFARGFDPNGYWFENSGPNPANPTAKFFYYIPKGAGSSADVRLRVYDVTGRMVRSLVDRNVEPGPHYAVWDGRDDHGRSVSSGTYYARIEAGSYTKDARVTILK